MANFFATTGTNNSNRNTSAIIEDYLNKAGIDTSGVSASPAVKVTTPTTSGATSGTTTSTTTLPSGRLQNALSIAKGYTSLLDGGVNNKDNTDTITDYLVANAPTGSVVEPEYVPPENGGDNGSGGSSTGGGTSSATSIYENYLSQILADQQAAAEARQKQLTENYNRALGILQQNHQNEVNNLQNNADESMRQAYINYMLGQKNINQTLSNMGVNGGATESILANLYNNYGANRNSIANELQNGLANLGSNYDSSVANLANTYGENLADVLADYYNQASSAKENYANKIASLLSTSNKSSSSSSSSSDDTSKLISNASKIYGNLVSNGYLDDANDYLKSLGADESTNNQIIWASGNSLGNSTKETYTPETRATALANLRKLVNSGDDNAVQNYINTLQNKYGAVDSEIEYLLNSI